MDRSEQWPLPQTRWTPFYLHEHGLLSEHEFWANEPPTVYVDSPYERGSHCFAPRRWWKRPMSADRWR